MSLFSAYGLSIPRLLLPKKGVDMERWSVIACDQHTSDPGYWQRVSDYVGNAPSTLDLIFPECFLDKGPDIPAIHRRMTEYRDEVLGRAVEGFVLVERGTSCGPRLGLVAAIDLECYDYAPGAAPLIRCTEGTVTERIPPRMAIRRGAALELSHVMVLADDPGHSLIEPLYARRDTLQPLYDFRLMEEGGYLKGWAVTEPEDLKALAKALARLKEDCGGFLFAVGDGNHSLATAKACWEELKNQQGDALPADHPARYAMVELVNLYDPALVFEPIHRALFGADPGELQADFAAYCREGGMELAPCAPEEADLFLDDAPCVIRNRENPLAVAVLQPFLDRWLAAHPECCLDYIHGRDALKRLDALGIRLTPMDKGTLFPSVRCGGPLPRKTFSMGEARDKRYYTECRAIR